MLGAQSAATRARRELAILALHIRADGQLVRPILVTEALDRC